MTYRFRFSAFQSLVSVLPKPLYLFLMLRFVGIKVFDKVCLSAHSLFGLANSCSSTYFFWMVCSLALSWAMMQVRQMEISHTENWIVRSVHRTYCEEKNFRIW